MQGRTIRLVAALLVGGATLTVAGGPASTAHAAAYPPEQFVGLATNGTQLVTFDELFPGTITSTVPVSGIILGDVLQSIDVRPATGGLYGVAVNMAPNPDAIRLYSIDRLTGVATPVGAPVTPGTNSTHYAMDFNPTVDRVRVVDFDTGNLRLNPNNGSLSGFDTGLSPSPPLPNVGGVAYDRNMAPVTPNTTKTTLFAIKASAGVLARIGGVDGVPSANGGVLTDIGSLGLGALPQNVGLDITPRGGAFLSGKLAGTDKLYTVNLTTGAAGLVGTIGTGSLGVSDIAAVEPQAVPAGASSYVGVPSHRLVDTRGSGKVQPGGTLVVPVTGRGPIPAAGVSAAVLNVTVTQPDAPGYATVWPSGTPITPTSSVNVDAIGQTRAALVTVPIGADGSVSVFSERGSHVIVDVVGYFKPASDYGGRLHPLTPARLLDTRTGTGLPDGVAAKPGDGATVEVTVAGRGGVPASGASAAVVNLTMTATDAPGYVTAYAGDALLPLASNLNATDAAETIANLAIVPIGAGGTIKLFTEHGTELIADVVGYFGADTTSVTRGLFVPVSPDRILDTRIGLGAEAGVVGPGWSRDATVAGFGGVPATGAIAFAGTVTATGSLAGGYVTAYPTSADLPNASTLNTTRAGQTIANSVILGLGTEGKISLFSETGTHLITDVTGYFLA